MAVHAGELHYDDHGVVGASVNLTFRLLNADPLRSALAGSSGVLALVTSYSFFEEVVRHSPAAHPTRLSAGPGEDQRNRRCGLGASA